MKKPRRSLAMKRTGLFAFLFFLFSVSAFADGGLYFDIGLGLGFPYTEIGGVNFGDVLEAGTETQVGTDFSTKLGWGPIAGLPFYVGGEFNYIGHYMKSKPIKVGTVASNYDWIFASMIIGPTVIFYPIDMLQLSTSLGYAWTVNDSSFPPAADDLAGFTVSELPQGKGIGFNISVAADLGKRRHGCLLGVKFFFVSCKLENSDIKQETSVFDVFVKYRYRHKPGAKK